MNYSNSQSNRDLVETALDTFGAAFHRRVSEETRNLWHELFDMERGWIVAKAIHDICMNDEKMPTPKRMREAIAAYKSNTMNSPTYTPGFDNDGVPCVFWSDEPTIPAYSAENSPIGRECWAKILRWGGQASIGESDEQLVTRRKKELQEQKVKLHQEGKL